MTGPLTAQLLKEHAKLLPQVDELRVIADNATQIPHDVLREKLRQENAFLLSEFLPHMEIEQKGWFPALELIIGRSDALEPMTHAHDELHRLIDGLGRASQESDAGMTPEWVLRARRTLYQLYALMKIHLAEEELTAPLLERELSEAQATGLAAQLEFGEPPARD